MARKVAIIADPGIDTAFALALALRDPQLEVVGLIATAGNVSAEQATANLHIVLAQVDPPRWPRIGAALPVEYPLSGAKLHGPGGLGGVSFPNVSLHQPTPGDKLLVELARQHAHELSLIVLGPATIWARSLDRDPELTHLLQRVVMMGGTWHEPGNATAVAEFHFYCDPPAARTCLHSGASLTLVPLDVTRKLVFSPKDLLNLPAPETPLSQFLRQIIPYGIRASSNLYGIEGFHLKDVLGVAAMSNPGLLTTQRLYVDVETRGELTRGMSVVDSRPGAKSSANVDLAIEVDTQGVRQYIQRILGPSEM